MLARTTDAGQDWTLTPLPSTVGHLDTLSCPSDTFCAGLAADSEFLQIGATNATFLSTSDGGATFVDSAIISGDSMQSLTCLSDLQCTALGWNNAQGPNDLTAGVAARTSDGGHTWMAGQIPEGLGVSSYSTLSCASASQCWMTGTIAIQVANPPQCVQLNPSSGAPQTTTTSTSSPQSPAVAAIAQAESRAASSEVLKDAGSGAGFSCSAGQPLYVGAIADTHDGGLTWTPQSLPDNVPQPFFTGLSCPSVSECWITGEDAVPERVGISNNGGSPLLLGTTNGGSTWSKVTFSVPEGAPNYLGQAYLSMGPLSCPSTALCVALGSGAQSAPSVPTYSLVSGSS